MSPEPENADAEPLPTEILPTAKPVTSSEKVKVAVKAPVWVALGPVMARVGAVWSRLTVSVTGPVELEEASSSVTDRVSVPSPRPDKSIPLIVSLAVAIVPVSVTAVPPPELEML